MKELYGGGHFSGNSNSNDVLSLLFLNVQFHELSGFVMWSITIMMTAIDVPYNNVQYTDRHTRTVCALFGS